MDIINRKSATTLLVCCLFGAGFFMDGGSRDDPAPPTGTVPSAAPVPIARGFASPPDRQLEPAAPATMAERPPPAASAPAVAPQARRESPAPQIGTGVRLPSAPLGQDDQAAAQRALAEDLDAILPG